MKIPAEIRYSLRLVLDLAAHGAPRTREQLAAAGDITSAYADKLLQKLKRSGLIRAVRGPKGGYQLNPRARSLTVLEFWEGFLGPVQWVPCQTDPCSRLKDCPAAHMWQDATNAFKQELSRRSINELAAAGNAGTST